MKRVSHFIAGQCRDGSGEDFPIVNPGTGEEIGQVSLAQAAEVDAAVSAAKRAFPGWSSSGLGQRSELMLELREALRSARSELVEIVVSEVGKTKTDAGAEIDRAIDLLAQAAAVGNWYGTTMTPGVSRDVDTQEIRYPIGIIAAITPFNFPVMMPVMQSMMPIVCGNTVVVKPSERDPSASLRIAQVFQSAGLPDGVFNVVMGDKQAVEALIEHPDVAGVSFVGTSAVARAIRVKGVALNKRVQAFGGGKNHMVVLPDADLDLAADGAVSAAFGAAGQRCMAVSVVVAVGDIGDELVSKIAARVRKLKIGPPSAQGTDIGPVITRASRDSILSHLDQAEREGAEIVVDGRNGAAPDMHGWFVAPSVIDHVKPGMGVHTNELFGPVLCVVRVQSEAEAADILANHPLGNGAAIFTSDGFAAKRFIDHTEAGQIGVNVPLPVPVHFHSFGGWKDSAFTETKLYGPGALNFCTRTKTVTVRWPQTAARGVSMGFFPNQ